MAFSAIQNVRRAATGSYRQARKKTSLKPSFSGKPPSTILYMGIGMLALFKDLLDLVVGIIPGVVTVISLCIGLLIWFLFLFDRSGGGKKSNRIFMRSLLLLFVALAEGIIIGINLLPIQTAVVVLLYVFAKRAWKKALKKEENTQMAEDIRRANQAAYGAFRDRQRASEARQRDRVQGIGRQTPAPSIV